MSITIILLTLHNITYSNFYFFWCGISIIRYYIIVVVLSLLFYFLYFYFFSLLFLLSFLLLYFYCWCESTTARRFRCERISSYLPIRGTRTLNYPAHRLSSLHLRLDGWDLSEVFDFIEVEVVSKEALVLPFFELHRFLFLYPVNSVSRLNRR